MKSLTFLILFLPTLSLFANSIYVQSPIAKILLEPNMSSAGKSIKQGQEVIQIGEEKMFLKIKNGEEVGWILKIYTSKIPTSNKANNALNVNEKSNAIQSRARASSFTETAAARGLSESKKLRTRGNTDEYDFEGLDWLDRLAIMQADFKNFKDQ